MPTLKTHGILFLIMTCATLLLHEWIPPYLPDGGELLTGNWSAQTTQAGRIDIEDGTITLHSTDAQVDTGVVQYIAPIAPGTILMLSADARSTAVVAGTRPWHQARLLLVQHNGHRNRWDLPITAISLSGTQPWENHRAYFTVAPDTQHIRVLAELSHATGSLQLKNIHLASVSEHPTYVWIQSGLLISWGLLFLLLLGTCLSISRHTFLMRLTLAFAFASIIIGTTLPSKIKNQISEEVTTQIHAERPAFKALVPWDLSKVWHVVVFFLLGLVLKATMKQPWFIHLLILILLATGTELAQLFISNRSPLVTDSLIDVAGGFGGLILMTLFNRIRQHQKSVR